jgi:hypothetical protein
MPERGAIFLATKAASAHQILPGILRSFTSGRSRPGTLGLRLAFSDVFRVVAAPLFEGFEEGITRGEH